MEYRNLEKFDLIRHFPTFVGNECFKAPQLTPATATFRFLFSPFNALQSPWHSRPAVRPLQPSPPSPFPRHRASHSLPRLTRTVEKIIPAARHPPPQLCRLERSRLS